MVRKRIVIRVVGVIIALIVLWWLTTWIANGGWPSSGPVASALPPHVQYVIPADGQRVDESYGFCVHFYYQAGRGMGEDPQQLIRYYFNGINVTRWVVDIVTLEYGYPDPVGEPCYTRNDPLRSGWHTAKVTYEDIAGERYNYTWRFQVMDEHQE